MFEQLKIKVALRQSIIWGIVLIISLLLVFTYNATVNFQQIDQKLDKISDMRYYRFFFEGDNAVVLPEKDRDTMAVFISYDGKIFISDNDMFSSETVEQIVAAVLQGNDTKGYLKADDRRVAYKKETVTLGTALYLCDYTEDYSNTLRMMIINLVAGAIGVVVIALISVRWARRNIAPVESAFEKQQELVANASHELKTPITIINTDLSILNGSSDNFTDEQKKWLENISGQVNRMSALVGEMLELARLEANGKNAVKEDVNLSTVAEMVVLGAEALAFEKNVTLNSDIKPDIVVSAVSANMEKLIYILLENALKYTSQGESVTIKVYAERKRAVLKVRNTGVGIKQEDVPKLFDRFYRVDESHGSAGGFGLGLAIAKSIVDISGGKIGVDSKEGEYTEFVVVFKLERV